MERTDPFTGPAPQRIPLPDAPLTSVLAQVRFAEVFSITKKEFIADFQERIRDQYPINKLESGLVLALSPQGPQARAEPHWRFLSADESWRVTLTTTFISLETRKYISRHDFISRLRILLHAVEHTIGPGYVQRIGTRYVDRIRGEQLDRLGALVRQELAGFASSGLRSKIQQSMHEALCEVDEGKLLARWGLIPENSTHDPEMMPAINEKSWMLDIDVFQEFSGSSTSFSADAIAGSALDCATRVYSFFRWVVTDEFLLTYGGEL
jgi:uncharacterized protein (TIGR04255 family)